MQDVQKLRRQAHFQVRRNDEVEAQSRSERDRWTFYETIFSFKLIITRREGRSKEKSPLRNGELERAHSRRE
jgi:hypothetical protein